jgi:uncharacterized protein
MTDVGARNREMAWTKEDPFGVEFAEIRISADRLSASGVCIGSEPLPYRLDYELNTDAGFVTSQLVVDCHGEGWRRRLDLRRNVHGDWTIVTDADGVLDLAPPGGDVSDFTGALDCDLGLSPLTNMMPILRHGLLHGGGPVEFAMAWVAVPSLSVTRHAQRYSHVASTPGRHIVRYEGVKNGFTADIILDDDGVVIDYPAIARSFTASL